MFLPHNPHRLPQNYKRLVCGPSFSCKHWYFCVSLIFEQYFSLNYMGTIHHWQPFWSSPFFCWHYNPLWVLAFSVIFFHSVLSLLSFLHPLIPIVWISSWTSSVNFFLGLPLILLPIGFHSSILLGILIPSIRVTCPSQAILTFLVTKDFSLHRPVLIFQPTLNSRASNNWSKQHQNHVSRLEKMCSYQVFASISVLVEGF